MVTLKTGDQDIDFMVDTGAELSMVTKPVAPLSKRTTAVTGASGEEMVKSFCQPRKCQMGGHQVTHEFLYIPECPVPLLGRDLLSKLGAQVTFSPEERPTLQVGTTTYLLSLSVPPQDEWRLHEPPGDKQDQATELERRLTQLFPEVWAEDKPSGLARHQAPVIIGAFSPPGEKASTPNTHRSLNQDSVSHQQAKTGRHPGGMSVSLEHTSLTGKEGRRTRL